MKSNQYIRVKETKLCYLCGEQGNLFYKGLKDRRCNTKGTWDFLNCSKCGLVWLNPYPLPSEFEKIYTDDYAIHEADNLNEEKISLVSKQRKDINLALRAVALGCPKLVNEKEYVAGKILSLFAPLKEIAIIGSRCLKAIPKGKILDVGCANGGFLAMMQKTGWKVFGVEPDGKARKNAQNNFNIPVVSEITDITDHCFDVVTMSHVVEHVIDPIMFLKEVYNLLRPGGKLVIITPNIQSREHAIFQDSLSHLDPPRHIYLFSKSTLRNCVQKAGFMVEMLRTTEWYSRGTWCESMMIRKNGMIKNTNLSRTLKFQGWGFQFLVEYLRRIWKEAGDELLLIATKQKNEDKQS